MCCHILLRITTFSFSRHNYLFVCIIILVCHSDHFYQRIQKQTSERIKHLLQLYFNIPLIIVCISVQFVLVFSLFKCNCYRRCVLMAPHQSNQACCHRYISCVVPATLNWGTIRLPLNT